MNSTARLTPARRILITAVALAISTAGVASAQQAPPPATVRTAIAENQLMAPRIELPGTVISRNDARIASEIPGRVDWVAEVGTKLETGDVIARIDDRMPQLQLRENDVIIKRLEANLNYQKRDVERIRELAATNNTPISRLDESVSRRDMTEQDLAQAQIARERTVYLLEHTKVRAPFSGRIVERLLKPGEYSVAGTEVARLTDVTNVEVRTQVPASRPRFSALFKWLPLLIYILPSGSFTTPGNISRRRRSPVMS